jgi:glutamine amidotransferase
MSIVIIDYGMSNLGSVKRAFEECGANDVFTSDNPEDLKKADKIVLPGVGSFCDGIKNLNDYGFTDILRNEVLNNSIPLLGICLGMQLLADIGFEGGEMPGLGLIPGKIVKLSSSNNFERIPHVGWNQVVYQKKCVLLENIDDYSDFYFVHSYHFIPNSDQYIVATTPHCGEFVSVVNLNNIYGTQFHPEKSSIKGFQIIKNFINI